MASWVRPTACSPKSSSRTVSYTHLDVYKRQIDLRLPFWFAAGLALLNFLYGWLVLPESLPVEKRAPRFDWSHANPFGSILLLKRYPQVFGLALVVLLANLAHYVYPLSLIHI